MILLGPSDPFPPTHLARQDLDGLLAIGADLSPQRLLAAYRQGIFPWGTLEGLPLWHAPDPRMVLFPQEIRISRSLRKILRRQQYEIRLDSDFTGVIEACANVPRPNQDGTWISREMMTAYLELHHLGWAHSVETWINGELAGGLYGLAIGRVFFGESMFSRCSNASKIAFTHLAHYLSAQQFGMIDCQMHTRHLASLGAREISGKEFSQHLADLTRSSPLPARWPVEGARHGWQEYA